MPLAQMTTACPAHVRRQLPGHGAHVLRRRDQQHGVARRRLGELPVARIAGSSATPGRNASLTWRALMSATTSASRAHRMHVAAGAAQRCASAVPQAPPPMTLTLSIFKAVPPARNSRPSDA